MTRFRTFEIRIASDARDATAADGSPRPAGRSSRLVQVGGEVDITTSPRLKEQLLALLHDSTANLVVDASRIEFIDASGINALIGAAETARQVGGSLKLRHPSRAVRRVLDILELNGSLPLDEQT